MYGSGPSAAEHAAVLVAAARVRARHEDASREAPVRPSSAAREWVMAVARVAELVAVKVADAVVAAAVVLMVVLVVDLAAASVEAATGGGDGNNFATFSETWTKIRLAQFGAFFTDAIATTGADGLLYPKSQPRTGHTRALTHSLTHSPTHSLTLTPTNPHLPRGRLRGPRSPRSGPR